jgi:hypothetical protein
MRLNPISSVILYPLQQVWNRAIGQSALIAYQGYVEADPVGFCKREKKKEK